MPLSSEESKEMLVRIDERTIRIEETVKKTAEDHADLKERVDKLEASRDAQLLDWGHWRNNVNQQLLAVIELKTNHATLSGDVARLTADVKELVASVRELVAARSEHTGVMKGLFGGIKIGHILVAIGLAIGAYATGHFSLLG